MREALMSTPEEVFAGRRRRFRREVFAALAAAAVERGEDAPEGWRHRRGLLAKERDGVFFAARIEPQTDCEITDFSLEAKPMAIDAILWDILEMPEEAEEPLCHRARGAFTCETPAMATKAVEDREQTPAELVEAFLAFAEAETERAAKIMAHGAFSEFLSASPEQIELGAYAIPLFCAYVAEGEMARAWAFAETNAAAESELGPDGFFAMALDWLGEARRPKTVH